MMALSRAVKELRPNGGYADVIGGGPITLLS